MSEGISLSDFHTKISVDPYGTIELSCWVDDDIVWLDDPQTKMLPARTFTASLIQRHLVSPKLDLETVSGLSDDLLASIAAAWLQDQRQNENSSPSALSLEDFKQAVYAYNEELVASRKKLYASILESMQPGVATTLFSTFPPISQITNGITTIVNSVPPLNILGLAGILHGVNNWMIPTVENTLGHAISEYVTGVNSSLYSDVFNTKGLIGNALSVLVQQESLLKFTYPTSQIQQLFAGLPNFAEYEAYWKEVVEGNQALEQSGYGFINHLISSKTIRRFASIHPNLRDDYITSEMTSFTESAEFEERLHELFQQSSVLGCRWKIVHQTLNAHRRHDYYISVPALFSQVEGLVGEILILKQHVLPFGYKLVLLGSDGKPDKSDKGRLKPVKGLDQLIHHSFWKDHPVLQSTTDFITTQLIQERNGVMHGRVTDYGTTKQSVQAFLLLFVLACECVGIEKGQVKV